VLENPRQPRDQRLCIITQLLAEIDGGSPECAHHSVEQPYSLPSH
jgi:hypothetical protein